MTLSFYYNFSIPEREKEGKKTNHYDDIIWCELVNIKKSQIKHINNKE